MDKAWHNVKNNGFGSRVESQRGAIETLQENNMKTNALGEGRPTP